MTRPTRVAARLAKFGNNIVRFHIMDMQRFPNGLLARNAKDTRTFDPEALDRLDYFTAQLIQRGVYIYLCTLNYRPFNAADGLPPEIEQLARAYQGRHVVGFFDPTADRAAEGVRSQPAAAPQCLHRQDVRRGPGSGDGRDQQRERPAPRLAGRDARWASEGVPDGAAWAVERVAEGALRHDRAAAPGVVRGRSAAGRGAAEKRRLWARPRWLDAGTAPAGRRDRERDRRRDRATCAAHARSVSTSRRLAPSRGTCGSSSLD